MAHKDGEFQQNIPTLRPPRDTKVDTRWDFPGCSPQALHPELDASFYSSETGGLPYSLHSALVG